MDESTIRQRANVCCKLFEVLVVICPAYDDSRKATTIHAEDQLARFKIWAGNIGVDAEGHGSLDYRLRDSPQARLLMLELLESLQSHLQRGKLLEIVQSHVSPCSNINTAIEIGKPSDEFADSRGSSLTPDGTRLNAYECSQSSAVSSSFHGTETESLAELLQLSPFEQRIHGVEQTIDRLYRLSIAIRRPSLVGQNTKAANFTIRDDEGNEVDAEFESYALKRATHQFPHAPPWLLKRLATAITLRRRRFLYRHRHQKKLRSKSFNGLPERSPTPLPPSGDGGSTIIGAQTLRVPSQAKNGTDNRYLKPLISQTSATSASFFPPERSRAMSFFEKSSQVSTAFQSSHEPAFSVQVPDAPQVSPGSKEFECPYCCLMLPIEEAKGSKWR